MSFDGIWEGKLDGTNWGQILLKLSHIGDNIYGIAQIIDIGLGTYLLDVAGTSVNNELTFELTEARNSVHEYPGVITGHGKLVGSDQISGEWKSSVGTYGTFQADRQDSKKRDPAATVKAIAESNSAFIMMAFGHEGSPSLPDEDVLGAISRACDELSIKSRRADQIEHSGLITDVLLNAIGGSRFLISDLTHERPNVYYEIGYAHGLKKEVILTAYEGTTIHFDIAAYNVIFYSSATDLEERIVKRLKAKLTKEERVAAEAP